MATSHRVRQATKREASAWAEVARLRRLRDRGVPLIQAELGFLALADRVERGNAAREAAERGLSFAEALARVANGGRMGKHKNTAAADGLSPPGSQGRRASTPATAASAPAVGNTTQPGGGGALPHLGVTGADAHGTLRDVLARRGITWPGEDRLGSRPTQPDPVLVAAQERQAAEARKRERKRQRDLGHIDGATAPPAELDAHLRERGLGNDGYEVPRFIAPKAEKPAPDPRLPRPLTREERTYYRAKQVEKRARNLADRLARGEHLDLSRVDREVFQRAIALRYGSYQG